MPMTVATRFPVTLRCLTGFAALLAAERLLPFEELYVFKVIPTPGKLGCCDGFFGGFMS